MKNWSNLLVAGALVALMSACASRTSTGNASTGAGVTDTGAGDDGGVADGSTTADAGGTSGQDAAATDTTAGSADSGGGGTADAGATADSGGGGGTVDAGGATIDAGGATADSGGGGGTVDAGGATIDAGATTACKDHSACNAGDYCKTDTCGAPGVCTHKSQFCPEVEDPVCGCDKKTYGNACKAAGNGVNVKSKGKCGGGGTTTPVCTVGATGTCKSTEYCAAVTSGQCSGKGICKLKPPSCPPSVPGGAMKVCGCDGKTYNDSCQSAAKGVNFKSSGACSGGGTTKSCTVSGATPAIQCAKTEYCALTGGACTGKGTCKAKPKTCPLLITPLYVCACNGQTYSAGPCDAAKAGVNVKTKGKCGGGGTKNCTVGGIIPVIQCAKTEYCALTGGACIGKGTCTTKPQNCIGQFAPVCGCDNKTYGNSCGAASAGMNFKSKAACPGGGGLVPTKCKAIKPGSLGMCKKVLGYAINAAGTACTMVGGCDCKSVTVNYCDAIYPTKLACETSCFKPLTGKCKTGTFKPYGSTAAIPTTCNNIRKYGQQAIQTVVKVGSACTKDSECKAVYSSTKCGPLCGVGINAKYQAKLITMMTWVEANICKLCKGCPFPIAKCQAPKPGCKLDATGQKGKCVFNK